MRASMLVEIFRFTLSSRLRSVSTWVYAAVLFAMAFLYMQAQSGAFDSASVNVGKVSANSPYSLGLAVVALSYFGVIIVASVFGRALIDDVEQRMGSLLFTTPLTRASYLFGRYFAAATVTSLLFLAVPAGLFASCLMPWVNPALLGDNLALAYLAPYLGASVSNALALGGLFLAIAAFSRRMMAVHTTSIILLLGYLMSQRVGRDLEWRTLMSLVDPFGLRAVSHLTEYWSIAEKNTQTLFPQGIWLWNRLLWLGVGLLCLVAAALRAPVEAEPPAGRARQARTHTSRKWRLRVGGALAQLVPGRVAAPTASLWFEVKLVFRNVYFLVITLAGALAMGAVLPQTARRYGTDLWPTTASLLGVIAAMSELFSIIVVTFFAGELLWRERDARIAAIVDSSGQPRSTRGATKLFALALLPLALCLMQSAAALVYQALIGGTEIGLGLYLRHAVLVIWPAQLCYVALALFLQVVINRKHLAYFAVVAVYVAQLFSEQLGVEHPLLVFASMPEYTYSDLYGFGPYLHAIVAYRVHWLSLAAVLAAAAVLLWPEGEDRPLRARLRALRREVSSPTSSRRGLAVLALAVVCFVASNVYIFINTNVRHRYQSGYAEQTETARYEREYKRFADEAQLRVTGIELQEVALYPREERVVVRGEYRLQNKSAREVTSALVMLDDEARDVSFGWDVPTTVSRQDAAIGVTSYTFSPALPPGATTTFRFSYELAHEGFVAGQERTDLASNGAFLSRNAFPELGYLEAIELQEDNVRSKHGLPPRPRARKQDDPIALANNYLGSSADWLQFAATVSTDADQEVLAPGDLVKTEVSAGRRTSRFEVKGKSLNFFAVLSGRYSVERRVVDRAGRAPLTLEVYHHPTHTKNTTRFLDGMQDAIAYCQRHFGELPTNTMRIVEFPRYATFAQSFPSTIPYSEAIGFMTRFDADAAFDYAYFITAHEVAHQWWAHQLIGANAQGATMLSESLAEYTALMVLEQKYGREAIAKYTRHDLDTYLAGRSGETRGENPLSEVEGQGYIRYQKGGMSFYALKDELGEAALNSALRALMDRYRFGGPPYPVANELVAELRRITPQPKHELLDDLFNRITLYDLRALSAERRGDTLELSISATKLYADALGAESEAPVRDEVYVSAFDAAGKTVARQKLAIVSGTQRLVLPLDNATPPPVKASIDPDHLRIDRKPQDNTVSVSAP